MFYDAFTEKVTSLTTKFREELPIDPNSVSPPIVIYHTETNTSAYKINISQYESVDHINMICHLYESLISAARAKGYRDILDIGSGIQCGKVVDATIKTSNPRICPTGTGEYFKYIEDAVGLHSDILLKDCLYEQDWIETQDTFDCVCAIRFYPWPIKNLPLTKEVYKNVLKEIDRVLKPHGELWCSPVDHRAFQHLNDHVSDWVKLFDEVNTQTFIEQYGSLYRIPKANLQHIISTL